MNEALLQLIACPACRGQLEGADSHHLRCAQCSSSYEIREGIPILIPAGLSEPISSRIDAYEQKHIQEEDPWHYGVRAAEILKHRFLLEQIRISHPTRGRTLDVGCSSGYLSLQLGEVASSVISIDVSVSAVMRARTKCSKATLSHCGRSFFVATATAFPFRPNIFDVVVLSDGLYEWGLPPDDQQLVLRECERVLAPSGIALFTDYLRPERFEEWLGVLKSGPLQVTAVHYLHDRPWYQFESAVHMIQGQPWVRAALRSATFAKALMFVGAALGKRGSKHIVLVAQKHV
ncbi:MAG: methyltransferase domain-containing protein [Bacteroidota bacterium]